MNHFTPVSTPYGSGFVQHDEGGKIQVQINAADMLVPTPSIIHNLDSHNRRVEQSAGVIMWFERDQVREIGA